MKNEWLDIPWNPTVQMQRIKELMPVGYRVAWQESHERFVEMWNEHGEQIYHPGLGSAFYPHDLIDLLERYHEYKETNGV